MTDTKKPNGPLVQGDAASVEPKRPASGIGRRDVVVGLGASIALLPLAGCPDDDDDGLSSSGTGGDSGTGGSSSGSGGNSGTGGSSSGTGGGSSTGGDSGAATGGSSATGGDSSTGGVADSGDGTCTEIPDETAGPYPDTMDMINNEDYERSDVREDRTGTDLTLTFTVLDATDG